MRAVALLLILVAACPTAACARQTEVAASPTAACGDLLGQAGRKPAGASFAGCAAQPERQGKPLVARYTVRGTDAAAVEKQLVTTLGMEPLRRTCCLWDAPPRSFVDAAGREYIVRMMSEETTVASRADWASIASFEVRVEQITEPI